MKLMFSPILFALLFLSSGSFAALAEDYCCRGGVTSGSYHQHMLEQYLSIWNGELSLIESTFHPDVRVFSDRFPSSTGNGSTLNLVSSRDEFAAFVKRARNGWAKYTFNPIQRVSNDHQIAVRWNMKGVLGNNFTLFPTPLVAGSAVTYNGTDFLVLDECTGLIREDYITQDLISYFYSMGLTEITV